MKTDVMPSFVQMDKEELKKLVTEVKETVATVIHLPEERKNSFGSADMWNILRKAKSANDIIKRWSM